MNFLFCFLPAQLEVLLQTYMVGVSVVSFLMYAMLYGTDHTKVTHSALG